MGFRSSAGSLTISRSHTILDLEVDEGCSPVYSTRNGCINTYSSKNVNLYEFEQLPHYLKFNPYIRRGYRAWLPASQCLSSLLYWNNESVNIWTHLIGFLVFFFSMFADNAVILTQRLDTQSHLVDHIFITLGLIFYQACMLLSSGYHMFHCHSEKACRRWLGLDLAGISMGLIGCYLPAVHLAFYCHQIWRDVYMFIIFCLAGVTLGLQFHPSFLSHSWNRSRVILYSFVAGYGIMPAVHWVVLNGGFESDVVQLFFGKIVVVYVLGLLAFFFYITKFPECYIPGRVDYIGSSHQWWHVIVVIAFLYWHNAGETILQYRMDNSCPVT